MPEKTVSIALSLSDEIRRFKLARASIVLWLLGGCYVEPAGGVRRPTAPPPLVVSPKPPAPVYTAPPADTHKGLFATLGPPAPVAVPGAPPRPLVAERPPAPDASARWVPGFWDWDGRWFWIGGRWVVPPRPGWQWAPPYYGARPDGSVAYVHGFWHAPGAVFVPPPPDVYIAPAHPPE